MGEIIYAYRTHPYHHRPITQDVVARWAGVSQAQLSRVESGSALQDLKRLMHWAHTLRIPARLLWFQLADNGSECDDDGGHTVSSAASEVSATLRRDFAALSGALVAGQALGSLESELDLLHLTLDRGTTSSGRVACLEEVADNLGTQVVRGAYTAVLRSALVSLRSVRTLLTERQPTRQQRRLVAAGAKLSTVVGEIMFNTGQFKQARDWHKAAQHAADDAGDGYLADIALGGRAYLPTYSGDPAGVLRLLAPRLDGNPAASPAIALLWGLKARAHAALGDASDFKRSIENARESLDRSASEQITPGILSFRPEKLAFYETTGAVQLSDLTMALDASRRALHLYDLWEKADPATVDTMNPVLVRLDRATALAQAGEVAEACCVATDALTAPSTYYGIAVHAYAHRFSERIRTIQCAETREWREFLAQVEKDRRNANSRRDKDT